MKRFALVGVLILVVACGGREPAPSAAPPDSLPKTVALSPEGVRQTAHSYSPDGRRIAYWSPADDSTGNWQLWVANADLSGPVKLPVTGPGRRAPWSPDGSRLAASSTRSGPENVVVVTVATGQVQRVTHGAGFEQPLHWDRGGQALSYYGTSADGGIRSAVVTLATGVSTPVVADETRPFLGVPAPDGSRVAYFLLDAGKTTIWVADSAGRNPRQLTTEGFEVLEQYREWSPDGKALLYRSGRTGTSDLWTVAADGGAPRQLTRNVRNDRSGAWSPDGQWVAFISDRGKQTDVWVVPAAGGEERRVTDSAAEEYGPLTWRGGSGELTFGVRTAQSGMWALDLADGKERRLTPEGVRVSSLALSSDGTQAAYVIDHGGGLRDLAVMPVAGGPSRVLVTGDDSIECLGWSPDGSTLLFCSNRAGTPDVWVVDVASGAARQAVNWPGGEFDAEWSGDGSAIYFIADRETRLGDVWRVPAAGGEPTRVTRDGSIDDIWSRAGVAALYASIISSRGGQLGIVRVREDGSLQTVWDRTNAALSSISPSGDVVTAVVDQPDGTRRSMILSATGGAGRPILKPNENVGGYSHDGKFLLYQTPVGGASDLGLLTVADGTTRRLTTTPEAESWARFTADGKTIVFRRTQTVERIHTVDLTTLLAAPRPEAR